MEIQKINEVIKKVIESKHIKAFKDLSYDSDNNFYLVDCIDIFAYDFDAVMLEKLGEECNGYSADALYLSEQYYNFIEFKNTRFQNTREIGKKQYERIKCTFDKLDLPKKEQEKILEAIIPEECTTFDEIKLKAVESQFLLINNVLKGHVLDNHEKNRFILVFNKDKNFLDGKMGSEWKLAYEMSKLEGLPNIFNSLKRLKVYFSQIITIHSEDFLKMLKVI